MNTTEIRKELKIMELEDSLTASSALSLFDAYQEELVEKVKRLQGDPFADNDDMLYGFSICKAKVLEVIHPNDEKEK